jgi:hypothetical protein
MSSISLSSAINASLSALTKVAGSDEAASVDEDATLGSLSGTAVAHGLNLDQVLAAAALQLTKDRLKLPPRPNRNSLGFLVSDKREPERLLFTSKSSVQWSLSPEILRRSVLATNLTIEIVHDLAIANNVPIFEILGLRNLSSFVGEVFARELQALESERLRPNPNQDGYPDLCALTPEGREYFDARLSMGQMTAKEFWSPFPYGGIEVKGTCGNTPAARKLAKPTIGESRYPILISAEWKAHHRETNNLAAIYWDFVDGLPTVLAVFFRNDVEVKDWGEIIQPKTGGGRTTSVSIMTRPGVEKMARGWIILPDHEQMLPRLLQPRVFPLSREMIAFDCSVMADRLQKR